MEELQCASSELITEKESRFVGYAVKTNSLTEVRRAYRRLKKYHPEAGHVIMAYYLQHTSGCQDDREHDVGPNLQKDQEANAQRGIFIFVARSFDGTLSGPKRFAIIDKVAKQALKELLQCTLTCCKVLYRSKIDKSSMDFQGSVVLYKYLYK